MVAGRMDDIESEMKAVVVTSPEQVECRNVPTPQPAPDEVLVRVAYCGICGSDVPRVWQGSAHEYPIILGHEFSGTVVSVGSGVVDGGPKVGTRVAGIPLVPCGVCDDCRRGDFALCGHYSFIGSRRPGAFAQYVAVPATNVFGIDDEVDFRTAAFFEPAAVAAHALALVGVDGSDTRSDERSACVIGCGTIGIFTAQLLRAAGFHVIVLARRAARLQVARDAAPGAVGVDTSKEAWHEAALAETPDGAGFDFIFDTSGNDKVMVEAFGLAANHACVCYVGTPKHDMVFTPRQWEAMNRRELTVTGSWMSYSAPWPGEEWKRVDEGFRSGVLRVDDAMVDSTYGIEEGAEAFSRFDGSGTVSGKVLIDCR